MEQAKQHLEDFRTGVESNTPIKGVLKSDFDNLVDTLVGQVDEAEKLGDVSPEQKKKDVATWKENIKEQMAVLRDEDNSKENLDLLNSVGSNLDNIVGPESALGKSLNKENLLRMIHKVVVAGHKDTDKLRDETKDSGMVLDVNDTEDMVNDILEDLKSEQKEETENKIVDLRELDDTLRNANAALDLKDNKCFQNMDNVEKLISTVENDQRVMDKAFSSLDLKAKLTEAVNEYKSAVKEQSAKAQPLLDNSELYKTLTEGLDDDQFDDGTHPL